MSDKSKNVLTTKTKVIFTFNDFDTKSGFKYNNDFKIGSDLFQITIHSCKDKGYKEPMFTISLENKSENILFICFDSFIYDSNMKEMYFIFRDKCCHLSPNWVIKEYLVKTRKFMAQKDKIYPNKSLKIGFIITVKPIEDYKCIQKSIGYRKTFNVKEFNDLHIVCGNKEFFVSKAVLTSHSEVFEKMFAIEMREQKTNQLIIEDIDGKVFKEFLKYIYFGNSYNLDDGKEELLIIAEKYQVLDLKEICENFIFVGICDLNAIKLLITFDKYNCDKMVGKTIDFISRNLWEIRRKSRGDWIELVLEHCDLHARITDKMSELIKDGLIGNQIIDNCIKSYTFSYIN